MPSASIATTSSKSLRSRVAIGIRARAPSRRASSTSHSSLRARGDDLLREDVERRLRDLQRVDRAAADRAHERRALDQLVARRGEEDALRAFAPTQWPERPMRCSATAIERGDPSCTTRSTEPMSMPSSSEAVATTARSSPFLSRCSASKRSLAREAAVMRQHDAFAEPLVERERDAFAHAARADEDSVVRCARISSATRS